MRVRDETKIIVLLESIFGIDVDGNVNEWNNKTEVPIDTDDSNSNEVCDFLRDISLHGPSSKMKLCQIYALRYAPTFLLRAVIDQMENFQRQRNCINSAAVFSLYVGNLQLALELAMKASTEAEYLSRNNPDEGGILKDKELQALETVKRICAVKSFISDELTVKNILDKQSEITSSSSSVYHILSNIISRAKDSGQESLRLSPEAFVERLLVEGSKMVTEASFDKTQNFTINEFRKVAVAIHKACESLASQYSHVKIGKISRTLVRKWLVNGNDTNTPSTNNTLDLDRGKIKVDPLNSSLSIDEEETINLVLDLNVIATGQAVWMDDVGCSKVAKKSINVISDEELFSLKKNSVRELSDYSNMKCGLSVAFVMSFVQEFHQEAQCMMNNDNDQENMDKDIGKVLKSDTKRKKESLLGSSHELNINTNSLNNGLAIEHARYLLKIVFAKSGSTLLKGDGSVSTRLSERIPLQSVQLSTTSKTNDSRMHSRTHGLSKTITFSMRHRALRAASILCPMELLYSVIEEENYFSNEKQLCSLSKCCFGSFLAMEIEAMGLPLPHSDLVQLSIMHYPSYARALLRHHGKEECHGFKGRLMLLLLELSLKDEKVSDVALVVSILSEMTTFSLPRTLLLGCECIVQCDVVSVFNAGNGEGGTLITEILKKLSMMIIEELCETSSTTKINTFEILETLERLSITIICFTDKGLCKRETIDFVESLIEFVSFTALKNRDLLDGILELVVNMVSHIKETKERCNFFKIISRTKGGPFVLQKKFPPQSELPLGKFGSKESDEMSNKHCMGMFKRLEKTTKSFHAT